jgi:hypothetical protein
MKKSPQLTLLRAFAFLDHGFWPDELPVYHASRKNNWIPAFAGMTGWGGR